jgi:guanosine-3',5'-bis(diphosphate) 3'-pyrophosphohydrolase
MTDDKALPKQERKQLQVEHASKLSVRAQTIKLADKISNLRSILSSPPPDWSLDRKREYFDWSKRVVDGLTAPNPILKAEFESMSQRFNEVQPGSPTSRPVATAALPIGSSRLQVLQSQQSQPVTSD